MGSTCCIKSEVFKKDSSIKIEELPKKTNIDLNNSKPNIKMNYYSPPNQSNKITKSCTPEKKKKKKKNKKKKEEKKKEKKKKIKQ